MQPLNPSQHNVMSRIKSSSSAWQLRADRKAAKETSQLLKDTSTKLSTVSNELALAYNQLTSCQAELCARLAELDCLKVINADLKSQLIAFSEKVATPEFQRQCARNHVVTTVMDEKGHYRQV